MLPFLNFLAIEPFDVLQNNIDKMGLFQIKEEYKEPEFKVPTATIEDAFGSIPGDEYQDCPF